MRHLIEECIIAHIQNKYKVNVRINTFKGFEQLTQYFAIAFRNMTNSIVASSEQLGHRFYTSIGALLALLIQLHKNDYRI